MERLKPRAEIILPDIRNRNRGNLDHSTGVISEMTMESIYDELEKIEHYSVGEVAIDLLQSVLLLF